MDKINALLIPIIILLIIYFGLRKKCDVYSTFVFGLEEGLKLCIKIFPTYIAMLFAINVFLKSNIINKVMALFFSNSCVKNIIPMIIMRPISGTGSLGILLDIFNKYGPDSFMGVLASTIQGCTDTTIYVLALYFGSINIKKSRYALWVGLFADMMGIISAFMVVKLFYY